MRLEHRPEWLFASLARAIGLALLAITPAGCQAPIDLTRVSDYTGTLGEEIHEIFCMRFAREAYPNDVSGMLSRSLCEGHAQPTADTPPRLAAMADERSRLAPALDGMMPEDTHSELHDLLADILPLYDDGTMPGATRSLVRLLSDISSDPQAINTYARISHHEGYRPSQQTLGVLRPMLGYADLQDVVKLSFGAFANGGVAHDVFGEVLRANALELATMPRANASDLPSNDTVARQLLFTEDSRFASGMPRYAVLRDARGVALPAGVDGTNVPAPYVDHDGDHLPDVDALDRYVDASGSPLVVPAPFAIEGETGVARDAQGRALVSNAPAYQYHDLDRTMLGGVVRELAPWVQPSTPTLVDLARGMPVLLGAPTTRTRTYGATTLEYPGFDPATGPTYDLLHATLSVLPRQEVVDGLVLVDDLFTNHESVAADLIETGLYGDRRADAHPEAALAQPNIFWDEMLELVARMGAAPGVLEAVVRSLDDDRSQDLDEIIANFARYEDAVSFDPADINAPVPAGSFTTLVNRSATDADPTNESLLQRSLYLINDLNGVKFCNKQDAELILLLPVIGEFNFSTPPWPFTALGLGTFDACALIEIDNVAEAYTRTLWGGFTFTFKPAALTALVNLMNAIGAGGAMDTLLENTTGITGMTQHPTPQALARLVFAPQNDRVKALIDEAVTVDGALVEDRHCLGRPPGVRTPCPSAAIFAWEKPIVLHDGRTRSFLEAVTPLIYALYQSQPSGAFYFGDLGSILHRHWPSRAATRTQRTNPSGQAFAYQDDIRSYEPLFSEIFDSGSLFHRLRAAVQVADGFTVRAGLDGVGALSALMQVMVDPTRSCVGSCTTGSLAYRDGRRYITWNDGTRFDGTGGRPLRYPSPIYLLLDALHAADGAWTTDETRHTAWLDARSRIVDQFFTTEVAGGSRRLKNRRADAMLLTTLRFLRGRIEAHRSGPTPDATGRSWAALRENGITESLSGPVPASLVRLVDVLDQDRAARDALLAMLASLLEESTNPDGVSAVLYGLSDTLKTLDDDDHLVPLLHVLSGALTEDAQAIVAHGGTIDASSSPASRSVDLLTRIADVDAHGVLPRVLAHSVEFPSSGAPVTRLETVMDVIAEVNRTTPDGGGAVDDHDVADILSALEKFLASEERGLERLYSVVQDRKVTP